VRVVVRPVDQPAEFVPFIHAAKPYPITHADRHTFREVNVVGNQQGFAIAQLEDEALMA